MALRDAVRELLPPGLIDRQKQGFTLPFPIWMKRELRPFLDATFADDSVDHSQLFARDHVQALWRGYLAGNSWFVLLHRGLSGIKQRSFLGARCLHRRCGR
jgi:asparagine synthetase B (glutamine-hydrolysing)